MSDASNNQSSREAGLDMGNRSSGPKKRPEITSAGIRGTLPRPVPPSGSSLRLPIPDDEELEKRY